MEIAWQDWLGMIIRWLHLATGIAWIGTSFFFIWLDLSLRRRGEMPDGVQGESWLVHGGGFYHAQKYSVAPEHLPAELHWFKYEAYFTWLSGFALLGVMYYWGAESFLIDPDRTPFSPSVAILVSLVFLGGGWLAYDGLCRSPVGQHTGLLAGAVFLLVTIAGWGLTQLFSDRAAFLHVGAVIGTIMSANVFFIIIPNQKKVVADLKAGRTPAPALGLQAKQRSLHNNYLTLPVLLLMVSAHYPVLFSGAATWGWLVIALILLIGGVVRHFFNTLHTGGRGWALLWQWPVAACIGLFSLRSHQRYPWPRSPMREPWQSSTDTASPVIQPPLRTAPLQRHLPVSAWKGLKTCAVLLPGFFTRPWTAEPCRSATPPA